MTINLLVIIELAFEAVDQNCGVGSLPINVIEALTFQGMIMWTWSTRVLLIKLTWELKIQVSFLKSVDTYWKPLCSPKSKKLAPELQ
jgi:hypothetical protein